MGLGTSKVDDAPSLYTTYDTCSSMTGLVFLVALVFWVGAILFALYRETIYRFWIFFRREYLRSTK